MRIMGKRKSTRPALKAIKSSQDLAASTREDEQLDDNEAVLLAAAMLRRRLSQVQMPEQIFGYEKEQKEIIDLIKRTLIAGESNSVLVIGDRGTGKTLLISHVLQEVRKEHRIQENLITVNLNGLLQTDDRLALKEMTRQLQLENTVGDRVFGSFAENLQFLLEALRSGDHSSKAIILILEEFDMFAQHKGQTLLYNLFDVCQSAQTPICVIGITCRFDVIELLEKRVKSRFSHRQVYLFSNLTVEKYVDVCASYLSLDHSFPHSQFADHWNSNVQAVLSEEAVRSILHRQFSLTTNVRDLISLLTPVICSVNPDHKQIVATDFVEAFQIKSTDSKSSLLHGVSILELCLIIAMKHLMEIYDGEPFNFEMIYSEYIRFAQRRSSIQAFDKAVVMKAFEHLLALELIRPLDGGTSKVQKEYRQMTLLLHPTQILDALQKYPNCPTEVKHWASSSV